MAGSGPTSAPSLGELRSFRLLPVACYLLYDTATFTSGRLAFSSETFEVTSTIEIRGLK